MCGRAVTARSPLTEGAARHACRPGKTSMFSIEAVGDFSARGQASTADVRSLSADWPTFFSDSWSSLPSRDGRLPVACDIAPDGSASGSTPSGRRRALLVRPVSSPSWAAGHATESRRSSTRRGVGRTLIRVVRDPRPHQQRHRQGPPRPRVGDRDRRQAAHHYPHRAAPAPAQLLSAGARRDRPPRHLRAGADARAGPNVLLLLGRPMPARPGPRKRSWSAVASSACIQESEERVWGAVVARPAVQRLGASESRSLSVVDESVSTPRPLGATGIGSCCKESRLLRVLCSSRKPHIGR